jgi:plasmid stabilization system protein ParE
MAALIWTEPAVPDLDAIADYIAIDDSLEDTLHHLARR